MKALPASIRLRNLSQVEIEGMLVENADETYAAEIALEIIKARSKGELIETTRDLYKLIEKSTSSSTKTQFKMKR